MIRVTFFLHGRFYIALTDVASKASAYADYAQTCGYGLEMELL